MSFIAATRSSARFVPLLHRQTLCRSASSAPPSAGSLSTVEAEPANTSSDSAPTTGRRPKFNLPAHKLRALISLYHQSGSFVTRDNLDAKIEEAFIDMPASATTHDARQSYSELRYEVNSRNSEPEFRSASNALGRSERAERSFETLYGTSDVRRPGLELLLEQWPETARTLAEKEGNEIPDGVEPEAAPIVPGTKRVGNTVVVLGKREKSKRQKRSR